LVIEMSGLVGLVSLKLLMGMVIGYAVYRLEKGADDWKRLPPYMPLAIAAGMGVVGATVNLYAVTL